MELRENKPIIKLIQDQFRSARLRLNEDQIDDLLLDSKLLLLLDGVNETPSDQLLRELHNFRESNSSTPMIFTTRDLGVRGDLGIAKKLEMQPLTDSQMQEFVCRYLPEQGADLLRQLQDKLRELCETPLLLKMLCDVFSLEQQIPQNRGQLFQTFAKEYDRLKHPASFLPSPGFLNFRDELLQHLAFVMMQADGSSTGIRLQIEKQQAENLLEAFLNQRGETDPASKAKRWLADLIKYHLLQQAANPEQIEFHHQFIQEYFAAEYLLHQLNKLDDLALKKLYLNPLDWTESLALMLGIFRQRTAGFACGAAGARGRFETGGEAGRGSEAAVSETNRWMGD